MATLARSKLERELAEADAAPELALSAEPAPQPELDSELIDLSPQAEPALRLALEKTPAPWRLRAWFDSSRISALGAGVVVALLGLAFVIPVSIPVGAKIAAGRHEVSTAVINSVRQLRARAFRADFSTTPEARTEAGGKTASRVASDPQGSMENAPSERPGTDLRDAPNAGPQAGYRPGATLNPRIGAGAALGMALGGSAGAAPRQNADPANNPAKTPGNAGNPGAAPLTRPGSVPTSLPLAGGVPPPSPDLPERLPRYYGVNGAAATAFATAGGNAGAAAIGGAQAAGAVGAAGLMAMGNNGQQLQLQFSPPPVVNARPVITPPNQGDGTCGPDEQVNPAWVTAPRDSTYATVNIAPPPLPTLKGGPTTQTRRETSYVKEIPPPPLPPHCIPKPPCNPHCPDHCGG